MGTIVPMEDAPELVANVYRERAEKLAQPGRTSPTGTPVLVFRLEKELYGIELATVGAVLGPLCVTPVPEAEEKLEGLINVKGTIRPVLNLRFLLNLPPASPDMPEYFLLLRRKQRELGIRVEEIERISGGSMPGTLTILQTSALFAEFWDEA